MRPALKWGCLLALAVILWTALVHLLGIYTDRVQYASIVDQVVIILPVIVIWLAIAEQQRTLGGTLPWGRGIALGTGTAAVSAPPTVAALWVYHHYINPDWVSYLVAYEQQKLAATGTPADQIAAKVAQLQQGGTDQAQIVGGLIGTVVMGVVLSIILTGIQRLRRR